MINYADPVNNLKNLVSFRSVSNTPMLDLCDWVASACTSFGFACELQNDPQHNDKANVIATIGPKVPGGLIISGHLDVVSTEGQPWKTDPFSLTEIGGFLYGRGSSDMKGFIAATFASFTQIDLAKLKKPLVLIWTYDEEIGCKGSGHFALSNQNLPDWYPREALIGEPTDMQIFRMHPGHVSFTITVTGVAAHSSKPELGASAILMAGRIIALLESLEGDLQEERRFESLLERPYVTLNIGTIHGGQAVNIVPDRCEIMVGYRPLPGDDPREVFLRVQERLRNLPHPQEIELEITLQNISPALLTQQGTDLENALLPHARTHKIGAAPFATDAGNLSTLGIQSLIFGPGSIDVAHRANECIKTADLRAAPAIIADVIRSRCE